MPRWALVTIDIDGTLTTVHGWRPIAAAQGELGAYERSERRIRAGREDEQEHLRRLFEMAVGLPRPRLERILAGTPRVRGIRATVQALHAEGTVVGLLTHNPAMIVEWYCQRYGFDGGSGGWGLGYVGDRVGPPDGVRADKVAGVAELALRFGVPLERTCHVGDAWPDARLAPILGGFVAFNPENEAVAAVADVVVHSGDLRSLLPVLSELPPRPRVEGARPLAESSNSAAPEPPPRAGGVRRPRRAAPEVAQSPPAERGRRAPAVPRRGGPGP